jgi:hypothetical protein
MPTTRKELRQQLAELKRWAESLEQRISKHPSLPKDDNAQITADSPVWEALKESAAEPPLQQFLATSTPLRTAAAPPRPDTEPDSKIELQRFLRQMSAAMVDAQSDLDARSAEYLAATSGKPHILPSIFRVPKLSAQMRFALEVTDGKAINLLFYKRDEKTTSRNEQSIDFDVVSVPAPPDAAKTLRYTGPRLDLLLDPFEREPVIDAIRSLDVAELSKLAADSPHSIAVLTLPAQAGRAQYLLLATTPQKEHSVGLWHFDIPSDAPPQIEVIYPINRKNSDNEKLLKDIVVEIARRQQQYFST